MRDRRQQPHKQPQAIAISATRQAPRMLTDTLPLLLAILASLLLGGLF